MAIQFRRTTLQAGIAALLSSAFYVQAADIPQVKVTVNDKQCEPMTLTVNSGKTQFLIQNHSQKALEWEILKGVMVVEERENIAPGFSQKMTANLEPGEYEMTCGLLTNPKGKLIVKGGATAEAALTPVKMITSKKRPIRNSPASTVWKRRCLAITALKGWSTMPINSIAMCWSCKSASASWHSRPLKSWAARQA